MNIIYLIIILVLMIVYFNNQKKKSDELHNKIKEKFVDNTFVGVQDFNEKPYNQEPQKNYKNIKKKSFGKPSYLPDKVDEYKYIGRLVMNNNIKMDKEVFLYGREIERIHGLYSYYIYFIKNKKIIDSYSMTPTEKIRNGNPVWVRDGPTNHGPFFLKKK